MRCLIDTNVVLDFLLDRAPFVGAAAEIWQSNLDGKIEGYISAITPVNVYYIARKMKGQDVALHVVTQLTSKWRVAPIDQHVLQQALLLNFRDFEDAVQYASALHVKAQVLITRNVSDYVVGTVPVKLPQEFIDSFKDNTSE